MSTFTEPDEERAEQEEHVAAWSEQDDWTEEALRLLRELRAPHRRKRAGQIGYALYCVALVLVAWGALPTMGLFIQKSMGADYTGHGRTLLAAIPSGICALGLGCLLLSARDALWRGPVVPPRDSADWLLAQPVRIGRVLRPWFLLSCCAWSAAGLLAAAIGMVALGLTAKAGLAAGFAWCAVGGLCLPLLAVALGVAVEVSARAAAWVRRLTPLLTVVVLALAGQSVLAANGHRVPWLERVELWSGPWGWSGAAALSPTPAAVHGGPVAAGLLSALTLGCVALAARATGTIPLAVVRGRARTASGVLSTLLTAEFRSARQFVVAAAASGSTRPTHVRLRAPARAALAVPWRDTLALLRAPGRLGRALLLAVIALPAAVLGAVEHRGAAVLATVVALSFAYSAVAQLLEPARIESDDTRRGSWAPYPYEGLMLRHSIVPLGLALVLSLAAGSASVLLGSGVRGWLAPAAAPALVAAALVNACRGASRQHLMLAAVQTPMGGMGPVLFLLWYGAGPLTVLVLLTAPFTLALREPSVGAVAAAWAVSLAAAAGLFRWAHARARKLTA